MNRVFVTATNTDVGKTFASETILKHYAKKGSRVGYFKPCETGVTDYALDGTKMLTLVKELNSDFKADINDVVPYQFRLPAAPYVAKGEQNIDFEFLKDKINYLETMCDFLVIEGAGGLMVPILEDLYMIDLIEIFEAKPILIAPSKLGCINDILLSVEALRNRTLEFELYINLFQDKESFDEVSKPFLQDHFGKLNYLHDLD